MQGINGEVGSMGENSESIRALLTTPPRPAPALALSLTGLDSSTQWITAQALRCLGCSSEMAGF